MNRRRGIQWGLHERLEDLDFADDICLLSQRHSDIKFKLDALKKEAEVAGLNINIGKTKTMEINATGPPRTLELVGERLESVDSFRYLGSTITRNGGAGEDVKNRIGKANGAFVQLYPLWRNRNISLKTKLRIFNTNVKAVLLYACETWRVDRKLTNQLQTFVNRCLRRLLNVWWPEIISNEDLWRDTGQTKIELQIRRRKWSWLGHTLRKDDGAIEKKALEWNPQGARRRGRPRGTWRRTVDREAATMNHTWGELRRIARDREGWRVLLDALCSS